MARASHLLRIKALRKAAKLTQQDLANMAGLSRSQLSEIETGATPANTYRLAAIARVLGVTVVELFEQPKKVWEVEAIELLGRLGHEDREIVLRIARLMVAAHSADPAVQHVSEEPEN